MAPPVPVHGSWQLKKGLMVLPLSFLLPRWQLFISFIMRAGQRHVHCSLLGFWLDGCSGCVRQKGQMADPMYAFWHILEQPEQFGISSGQTLVWCRHFPLGSPRIYAGSTIRPKKIVTRTNFGLHTWAGGHGESQEAFPG